MTDGRPIALDLRHMEGYLPVWGQRWCPSQNAQQSSEYSENSFQATDSSESHPESDPTAGSLAEHSPVSQPPAGQRLVSSIPEPHPPVLSFNHPEYSPFNAFPPDHNSLSSPSTSLQPPTPRTPHSWRPEISSVSRSRSTRHPELYSSSMRRGSRCVGNGRNDRQLVGALGGSELERDSPVEPHRGPWWSAPLSPSGGPRSGIRKSKYKSSAPSGEMKLLAVPAYEACDLEAGSGSSSFATSSSIQPISDSSRLAIPFSETAYPLDLQQRTWDAVPAIHAPLYGFFSENSHLISPGDQSVYPSLAAVPPTWDDAGSWPNFPQHAGTHSSSEVQIGPQTGDQSRALIHDESPFLANSSWQPTYEFDQSMVSQYDAPHPARHANTQPHSLLDPSLEDAGVECSSWQLPEPSEPGSSTFNPSFNPSGNDNVYSLDWLPDSSFESNH